jgi:hypothetical protein
LQGQPCAYFFLTVSRFFVRDRTRRIVECANCTHLDRIREAPRKARPCFNLGVSDRAHTEPRRTRTGEFAEPSGEVLQAGRQRRPVKYPRVDLDFRKRVLRRALELLPERSRIAVDGVQARVIGNVRD